MAHVTPMKRFFKGMLAAAAMLSAATMIGDLPALAKAPVYVIGWSPRGDHDGPPYIAKHLTTIESRPFDGIIINDFVGRNLFDPPARGGGKKSPWSESLAEANLSPLAQSAFSRFTQNFTKVNMGLNGDPPDLSDDAGWNIVAAGATNYAAAVMKAGFRGIFLDNEIYSYDYWIPKGNSPQAGMMLRDRLEAARARGRQFMQALMAGYPNIVVIVAHSPQNSCLDTPRDLIDSPPNAQDASGYFTAGMVEVSASPATIVDGGEIYRLRSADEFARSAHWRKYGIAQASCGVVPFGLRSSWSRKLAIGFAVYDLPYPHGIGLKMNPAIFRSTLANAIKNSDSYVWNYSEAHDWWAGADNPVGGLSVGQDWLQSMKDARRDSGLSVPN